MTSRLPLVATLVLASCAGSPPPSRIPIESETPAPPTKHEERFCADGAFVPSVKGLKLEPPSLDGLAPVRLVLFTKESPSAKTDAVVQAGCSIAPSLAACWKATAPRWFAAGYVELALEVGAKGDLMSASRVDGPLDDELVKCMQTAFATGHFGSEAHGRTSLFVVARAPARVVRMTENDIESTGALPRESIKSVVRNQFPAMRKCFEQLAKGDAGVDQLAQLRFKIDEQGKPTDIEVGTPDPVFRACLGTVVSGLSFEHPEKGTVLVKYPIHFQSDN